MKTVSATLMFCLLVNQMLHTFGNIIILRTYTNVRKLTCHTEDDGSALVWNIYLPDFDTIYRNNLCKLSEQNKICLQFYNRINMMFQYLMEYLIITNIPKFYCM